MRDLSSTVVIRARCAQRRPLGRPGQPAQSQPRPRSKQRTHSTREQAAQPGRCRAINVQVEEVNDGYSAGRDRPPIVLGRPAPGRRSMLPSRLCGSLPADPSLTPTGPHEPPSGQPRSPCFTLRPGANRLLLAPTDQMACHSCAIASTGDRARPVTTGLNRPNSSSEIYCSASRDRACRPTSEHRSRPRLSALRVPFHLDSAPPLAASIGVLRPSATRGKSAVPCQFMDSSLVRCAWISPGLTGWAPRPARRGDGSSSSGSMDGPCRRPTIRISSRV